MRNSGTTYSADQLRNFIWYRPPSLATLTRLTDTEIKERERGYVEWLAEQRNISLRKADALAHATASVQVTIRLPHKPRAETKWVSVCGPVEVRECYCYSAHAKEEWNGSEWESVNGTDTPTVYRVFVNGKRVNSFLSVTKAKAFAQAKATELTKQARLPDKWAIWKERMAEARRKEREARI